MPNLIRFLGLLNLALWLGAALFFTFGVGPAVFSDDLKFLGRDVSGRIAQVFIGRFFTLQLWCAAFALLHLAAEHLFMGEPKLRPRLVVASLTFLLALASSFWLLPHMTELREGIYAATASETQRAASLRSFRLLHGLSSSLNLLVIVAVLTLFWYTTRPPKGWTSLRLTKIQG